MIGGSVVGVAVVGGGVVQVGAGATYRKIVSAIGVDCR
jgi:hypothetical protein